MTLLGGKAPGLVGALYRHSHPPALTGNFSKHSPFFVHFPKKTIKITASLESEGSMRKMAIFCLLGLAILIGWPQSTMSVTMSIVTVTAYHPGAYAKGSPRGITASGKRVAEGMLAVSRDVERNLNLDFGDQVLVHGMGVFKFQDRMNPRCKKKVDVYMKSTKKARAFGVRRYVVIVKMA
jgi:3D (Asp-Asp-Asp) domain-containing protein